MNKDSTTSLPDSPGKTLKEMKGNRIVVEREFKHRAVHTDQVTGLVDLSDSEFVTCGVDNALKIWDKELKACDYTIETHEPLHAMAITGERSDLLMIGIGEGKIYVFGLTEKNQHEITKQAHQAKIIQVVSLKKLQNKYFATRCALGTVIIQSAAPHPD